jgi:hypothetical protein
MKKKKKNQFAEKFYYGAGGGRNNGGGDAMKSWSKYYNVYARVRRRVPVPAEMFFNLFLLPGQRLLTLYIYTYILYG